MPVDAYVLLGLTVVIGILLLVVAYAVVRFRSAARGAWRSASAGAPHPGLMVDAVQEAVLQLRDEGRQMRVRAEASERLSDQIVANMSSGLLLVGVDGRVRTANPAGRRLLGLGPGATGHFRDLLAGRAGLARAIEEALRDGRPLVRHMVRCDDTEATVLELTASPMCDRHGDLQAVICLFDDVTAVLALEEQLRLKDSLARLGELTAGIAHEFRNGLATIHGYARLIDPALLSPSHATCLHGIREGTDALGQVVTNFLNFARPVPLTLSTVDLRGLAARAADEIRGEVEGGGGSVEVLGTFPEVDGDEVMLRQALHNLCRNAAEACRAGRQPAHISIVGASAGDCCRVVVSDNGTGIEHAALERIFQPFFSTRAGGTGLGLALVRKVVVTHNGRITAANREGGGAVFEMVLPLQQASRAS
jgi:signal transduction histidine kinase